MADKMVGRPASGIGCRVSSFRRPSDQGWRPSSGVCCPSSAFTLIEVLVAMTVLAVLVLMVANIFQSSSIAWNIGTQKSDMNTAARAALDFIARELESAVAGPIEKSVNVGAQYLTMHQKSIDCFCFLTMTDTPGPDDSGNIHRALKGVYFWKEDQCLQYTHKTDELDCYANENWYLPYPSGFNKYDVITNILDLQFYIYTNESDMVSGTPAPFIKHFQLPICVDIALEMMSDDDMLRWSKLSGADQTAFRDRNAKLYTTRVYFPNRVGYGGR